MAASDLNVLINHRDAVAALQGYYARVWDRILRDIALGISRPGPLQTARLLSEVRSLLALLNPNGDTYVRRWIRSWAKQGMGLGIRTAQAQIQAQDEDADPVQGHPSAVAAETASLVDKTEKSLTLMGAAMFGSIQDVIRRTFVFLTGDEELWEPARRNVVKSPVGREVSQDIADILLRGSRSPAIARLRMNGLPQEMIDTYDRMYDGTVFQAGGKSFNLEASVQGAGSGLITDTFNAGVKITATTNAVDHVRITNPTRVGDPDVCTVFAGHVFYVGAGDDPLGFPALRDVPKGGPKFHPHCRHAIQPYVVRLKSKAEITAARDAANAIPDEFFNVDPYTVTKAVRKLDPAKVNPIARGPKKEKVA